jgi:hypothetical protein
VPGCSLYDATVINSTVSGNHAIEFSVGAQPNGHGAGFYVGSGPASTLELYNVTVADNHADYRGGGVAIENGSLNLQNSIIADNTGLGGADDCFSAGLEAPLASGGYNIIGVIRPVSCPGASLTGDHIGTEAQPVDAGLLALADNGGPTRTHGLAANSIAIDGADPAGCKDGTGAAITTDQRGATRANGGSAGSRCDIGSFEVSLGTDEAIGDGGAPAATLLLPLLIAGWMRQRQRLRSVSNDFWAEGARAAQARCATAFPPPTPASRSGATSSGCFLRA